MSKKEKPASQTGRQEEEKKSNNTFYIAMAVVLIFAVGGGFLYGKWNRTSASKQTVGKVERGGEARPTLSPALFFGKTSNAYKVAQEIPEVLDSLFCYCYCKPNFGHKSLLTCYVDDHGANCDICINEALRAGELHKAGKTIPEIRAAIDKEFYRP
ncbi:MAG: CYCXC family (seleno)protein [Nitrospirota bacterium]